MITMPMTADLSAGWTPRQRSGAEAEHGMVAARRIGGNRTAWPVDEMATAAGRSDSGRPQTGNRPTVMADVDGGKPVDDRRSETPVNMATGIDHSEIADLPHSEMFTQYLFFLFGYNKLKQRFSPTDIQVIITLKYRNENLHMCYTVNSAHCLLSGHG